jgi:predicted kinase
MQKKILIMGLPRAGKTTLAEALRPLLRAVHFNADAIRAQVNKDLGFTVADRIEQARRMGWLCDQVVSAGHYAVADFVCPTPETRAAFGEAFTVYLDTDLPTPYADTQSLFVPPENVDYRATTQDAAHHAVAIVAQLASEENGFNWRKPTALFLGRYQPFHDGHKALVLEGIERVGQACIAVRDTEGTDKKNPFGYTFVRNRIEEMMSEYMSKIAIVPVPNITNIFYGRDVGYSIERIDLSEALQAISATNVRKTMGL